MAIARTFLRANNVQQTILVAPNLVAAFGVAHGQRWMNSVSHKHAAYHPIATWIMRHHQICGHIIYIYILKHIYTYTYCMCTYGMWICIYLRPPASADFYRAGQRMLVIHVACALGGGASSSSLAGVCNIQIPPAKPCRKDTLCLWPFRRFWTLTRKVPAKAQLGGWSSNIPRCKTVEVMASWADASHCPHIQCLIKV